VEPDEQGCIWFQPRFFFYKKVFSSHADEGGSGANDKQIGFSYFDLIRQINPDINLFFG